MAFCLLTEKPRPTLSIRQNKRVNVSSSWICCRFVLTVSIPHTKKKTKSKNPAESIVVFLFFPQGFPSTGRDKPGFRPEFLPLTYLAKILSDIEEKGSMCVCVVLYPAWFRYSTEAFGGLRQNVRAWSKCSSLGEGSVCMWCYILYNKLHLSLTLLLVFQL